MDLFGTLWLLAALVVKPCQTVFYKMTLCNELEGTRVVFIPMSSSHKNMASPVIPRKFNTDYITKLPLGPFVKRFSKQIYHTRSQNQSPCTRRWSPAKMAI
jgi:hypothetical protein